MKIPGIPWLPEVWSIIRVYSEVKYVDFFSRSFSSSCQISIPFLSQHIDTFQHLHNSFAQLLEQLPENIERFANLNPQKKTIEIRRKPDPFLSCLYLYWQVWDHHSKVEWDQASVNRTINDRYDEKSSNLKR